jgi:hypothetical protein
MSLASLGFAARRVAHRSLRQLQLRIPNVTRNQFASSPADGSKHRQAIIDFLTYVKYRDENSRRLSA